MKSQFGASLLRADFSACAETESDQATRSHIFYRADSGGRIGCGPEIEMACGFRQAGRGGEVHPLCQDGAYTSVLPIRELIIGPASTWVDQTYALRAFPRSKRSFMGENSAIRVPPQRCAIDIGAIDISSADLTIEIYVIALAITPRGVHRHLRCVILGIPLNGLRVPVVRGSFSPPVVVGNRCMHLLA
jgi:hypothetical protein